MLPFLVTYSHVQQPPTPRPEVNSWANARLCGPDGRSPMDETLREYY